MVDGKVAEHWFQLDAVTLFEQLGLRVVPGLRLLPRLVAAPVTGRWGSAAYGPSPRDDVSRRHDREPTVRASASRRGGARRTLGRYRPDVGVMRPAQGDRPGARLLPPAHYRNGANGSSASPAPEAIEPLLRFVRLGSERARHAVRSNCSSAKKQVSALRSWSPSGASVSWRSPEATASRRTRTRLRPDQRSRRPPCDRVAKAWARWPGEGRQHAERGAFWP